MIELPKDEFEILRQDDEELHLYDKVVDKLYVYIRSEKRWIFPRGSRVEIIAKLTGVEL